MFRGLPRCVRTRVCKCVFQAPSCLLEPPHYCALNDYLRPTGTPQIDHFYHSFSPSPVLRFLRLRRRLREIIHLSFSFVRRLCLFFTINSTGAYDLLFFID